jgi:hypothetical protein
MVVLNFRVIKEIQEKLDPLDQKGLKDQWAPEVDEGLKETLA